jgi:S-DNA-T family DNA segregation ATPase FtsK/SpoIIIE
MASRSLNQRLSQVPAVSRGREILGILVLALALFIGLSLFSLLFGSGKLMGPAGARLGLVVYAGLGIAGYVVAWAMVMVAARLWTGKPVGLLKLENVGYLGLMLSAAVLLHTAIGAYRLQGHSPGGAVGEYTGELLTALVSTAGTVLLALALGALSLVLCTQVKISTVFATVRRGAFFVGRMSWSLIRTGAVRVWAARPSWPRTRGAEPEIVAEPEDDSGPEITETPKRAARAPKPARSPKPEPAAEVAATESAAATKAAADDDDHTEELAEVQAQLRAEQRDEERAAKAKGGRARKAKEAAGTAVVLGAAPEQDTGGVVVAAADASDTTRTAVGEVIELEAELPPRICLVTPEIEPPPAPHPEPIIVEPQFRKKKAEEVNAPKPTTPEYVRFGDGEFKLPGPDLLDYQEPETSELDKDAMKELAVRLEQALADYGVKGSITEIHPGPVVTMYEFVPEAGTRVAKIANLTDDLAMRLAARSVRIVAPIPGKGTVGIEVPNKTRETVYLKEIATDDVFTKSRSKLTMALGKDIEGCPVAEDLVKMPHLLVAGTTGSGKSVSMHGMITSILMNATPDEVRMIMVDPKRLEFAAYEGIPHLLLPVVTDPQKANLALKWACDEMDRRYELLAQAAVRDIVGYNKKVEKIIENGGVEPKPKSTKRKKIQVVVTGPDGEEQVIDADAEDSGAIATEAAEPPPPPPRKLPYIVIVIDEFADLMMCASKDVETSVARLAQKARAAGLHLILATQRPSVDVITGLIKSNFPSRMALKVAQRVDSRTILDQQGAESLLGNGDMLFSKGGAAPVRVHGAYVSSEEVERVVAHLKEQGQPVYELDILRPRDEDGAEAEEGDDAPDELYDQAVAIVTESRKASISFIQRRLRVGYNRSARMVERMEREGVVGPPDHKNEREVLVQPMAV